MKIRILLAVVVCSAGIVHALDVNGNGLSDVWEGLYPAAFAPEADLDGDGVSNLAESLAWTDPGDGTSVFRMDSFSNGLESLSFEWAGMPWQRYQVRSGTNLQDWKKIGSERTGSGGAEPFSDAIDANQGFYLVQALPSLNSDTDALTNLEENHLGTDPELWDSDGDKVADDQEFLQGSNPLLSQDVDTDGLPDDWERWIIHADANDSLTTLADVDPAGDFDNDGVANVTEYALGTSPIAARRNIVFFLTEDQSYHLGCLGTVGLDTPTLDTLGTSGVIFERAFCLSPVCSPSKMAIFTGTYPHMNSAYRNVQNYGTSFPLPTESDPSLLNLGGLHEDLPTLIEIFRDRGYFTVVSSKTHVQPIRKFPYHAGYGNPGTPAQAASYINDALSQAGDRPLFFLFNVGSPHLPFRNLPNVNGQWSPTGGLTGDGHVLNVDAKSIEVPACYPDVPGVRQDIADYYGAIEVLDSIYGSVSSTLAAAGEADRTLILFTGDHGIGLHRAKQSIYGAGMQVPFLFGGAGVTNGIRSSEPVSHVDIAPTLLEFSGIPAMPSMIGKSLWPILSGKQNEVSGRDTVLTACHDKYDARAVCDGRYYYIRNIRQISGCTLRYPQLNGIGIDPVLDIGLNTDQYAFGSPWYNRTFTATEVATNSPQRELLRQLLEGDLPDEELYDIDNDLWMTNNLAADPAMKEVLERLRPELSRWRMQTEDYTYSPDEMVRRTEQFMPLPEPPISGNWADSFDGKLGNLNSDTNWTTRFFGNGGADFQLGNNRLDAPPGPLALATFDAVMASEGQDWAMTLDTGFYGVGVIGAAIFGYQDTSNYYALQIQDLLGVDTGAWVVRFVRRVNGIDSVLWEVATTDSNDGSAVFNQNTLYRLKIDYSATTETFALSVSHSASPEIPLYSTTVSDPTYSSGSFGLMSKISGASAFDNFAVQISE